MDGISFNYRGPRAQKARFSRYFTKFVRFGLLIGVAALAGGGILLLADSQAFGWALLGLAVLPGMMYQWWRGELRSIPIDEKTASIDGLMESMVLGRLGAQPTPQQIAMAVMSVNGGQFFAVRFGLGPNFLRDMTLPEANGTPAVWQEAMKLRDELGRKEISAVMLVAALLRSYPNLEMILAHLQLDEKDLLEGAYWYHHIQDLIAKEGIPKRTGGLARDWSFGYIPLLKRFGLNISERIARSGHFAVELEAHAKVLDQMLQTFSSNGRQNITLVGPAGAGKTTLVHSFAERLLDAGSSVPENLKFRQVISLDPSALISSAPGRGELEGLVNHLLVETYKAKNVILCLDDAQLFFEESVGSVDLSNVLLPVLEGGGLRMILTMDEQRWLQISQRNPSLVNALNRVVVPPANEDETMRVLQDQLIVTELQRNVTYMYQSLREAATEGVVLNREDPRVRRIADSLPSHFPVHYFGLSEHMRKEFPNDDELHHKKPTSTTETTDPKQTVVLEGLDGQTASFTVEGKKATATLRLSGIYNIYNAAAALALVKLIYGQKANDKKLISALEKVTPAFGRGETLTVNGYPLELVLVKNPAGFQLALQSFMPADTATMIAINDNYADGRDMSWLWDVDFASLKGSGVAMVSGVRAYDMALRLQYDLVEMTHVSTNIRVALSQFLENHPEKPKRIFCTYTAMLALRHQLKKITEVEHIS
ncbi:domain of unknown function DUF1727 [candidate division TM7 genomosp. GTL1]|nr:domain of unknown function DUF1727 [candidate division TM7 genomosp. GTL1]